MSRPRGFIDVYNPKSKTLALFGQVEAVLATYAAELPLTARQAVIAELDMEVSGEAAETEGANREAVNSIVDQLREAAGEDGDGDEGKD